MGKKLDFLMQEFNRETNTICSKSNDLQVTGYALELKNEIESKESILKKIEELKKQYFGKMEIFFGFEADYLPPLSWPDYSYYKNFNPDYLIGSVHFVWNHDVPQNGTMTVDDETEKVKIGLENKIGGRKI